MTTSSTTTALAADTVDVIENSELAGLGKVHIDDVIEYVNDGLRAIPTPMKLYERYLRQRWNVYELDFSQDKIDWHEKMTDAERAAAEKRFDLPVWIIDRLAKREPRPVGLAAYRQRRFRARQRRRGLSLRGYHDRLRDLL